MVADPPGTQADRVLQAALAEHGSSATPAQFKRWRHHRILDSPERPGVPGESQAHALVAILEQVQQMRRSDGASKSSIFHPAPQH